ncbi:hypothetical protein OPT61_g6881 [Boeremia exigua]|uniref:Uncharacterized protein n=1 Tax=Boeremia exigua TaxID=749465 RepID=A0ACC2I4W5_9PLEO|nr:hypothetical protein OPT61_g6881 [Boeremia exigua]
MEQVGELEAFAAVVYSSNFEFESPAGAGEGLEGGGEKAEGEGEGAGRGAVEKVEESFESAWDKATAYSASAPSPSATSTLPRNAFHTLVTVVTVDGDAGVLAPDSGVASASPARSVLVLQTAVSCTAIREPRRRSKAVPGSSTKWR